jgi:Ser/Thr protein kinase RdoA (MazF antagonist)
LLSKYITDNYALDIDEIKLLDSHFGTEIYLVKTRQGKYIVKSLPLQYGDGIENEGSITDYLLANGLNVPKILWTNSNLRYVKNSEIQFHIQEFVEGETL